MSEKHYITQRLSIASNRCTIRYIGPVKSAKEGQWLGIEWDDPEKGKHDGSHNGMKYFECQSKGPATASFIRLSRPMDQSLSFLEALATKYASKNWEDESGVRISGKQVEEVGFQQVQQHFTKLTELPNVLLESLCIAGLNNRPWTGPADTGFDEQRQRLKSLQMKAEKLDLTSNLLEQWTDVACICNELKNLRHLVLSENRIRDISVSESLDIPNPFSRVQKLTLTRTFLSWAYVATLLDKFPLLTKLTFRANGLESISTQLPTPSLSIIDLAYNNISSLSAITPLAEHTLIKISLRGNPLKILQLPEHLTFPTVKFLDLGSTLLSLTASLNSIPTIFPSLISLLTRDTPVSKLESSTLYTIGQIATLKELNYSDITPADRVNAELYYLSSIAKSLIGGSSDAELLRNHPRWAELCDLYGTPELNVRQETGVAAPGSLRARTTNFTFYMLQTPQQPSNLGESNPYVLPSDSSHTLQSSTPVRSFSRSIPRTTDIYRLKGIVGRLFRIQPLEARLVWESGEWDPVGGEEGDEWSVSEDEGEAEGAVGEGKREGKVKGEWKKREVELVDGTRAVGEWVEGTEAQVRVEFISKE